MSEARRVLITRPEPDASATARLIEDRGGVPVVAPILTIGPRPAPLPIEPGTVLAFTSANGVRAYARSGAPARPACCVGPVTAAAAREAGLPVAGIAAGDVASLAELLVAARPASVLHVRGVQAAGDLAGRLAAAGLRVKAAALYEAVPAERLPETAETALRAGCDALLYSPRSARLLAALMRRADVAEALTTRRLGALSQAVADAFDLPAGEVLIPPMPSSSGLVDFLLQRRT